jgi:hypothetical protein
MLSQQPPLYVWDDPFAINRNHKIDPINLVFINTDLSQILAHLDSKGWHYRGKILDPAKDLYTPDNPPRKVQDAHRMYGPLWQRYHIRIWEYNELLVANAHYETLRHYGHEVHHYEGAEQKVADDFDDKNWIVRRDFLELRNFDIKDNSYRKYHNGYATVISR